MKSLILLSAACMIMACASCSANTYSYVDLVGRMVDMESVAILPEPGETRGKFSSFDRRSRYDAETGEYIDWDANLRQDRSGDGDGIVREENGVDVLADIEGPGCLWRIYSGQAQEGRVKLLLDGADEPVADMPFKDYLSSETAPFDYPALVYQSEASSRSNFVPVPFQKSCKIVGEKGWGRFYHFTYATYPKHTKLPTFDLDLTPESKAALKRVNNFFAEDLGTNPTPRRTGEKTITRSIELASGATAAVASIEGEGAITALKVKMLGDFDRDEAAAILRSVALQIRWDGEEHPSVWAPLGDFFGTVPGVNYYKSLPLGMTEDGFYCYWFMPFADGAAIELVNDGAAACLFETSVTHAPLSRPVEDYGRFHAKWHRDAFLPTDPGRLRGERRDGTHEAQRALDWTILKIEGRGRYCGTMLHIWHPKQGWWGEGDEKFFVDGEKFPSSFGTGTEEYFGYGWCRPDLFQRAYHGQTFNGERNSGHVSLHRWHLQDNVPFQTSFEGAIGKYFPNENGTIYAATAYWYQEPGSADPYRPASLEKRTGYYDYIVKPLPKDIAVVSPYAFNLNLGKTTGGRASVSHIRIPADSKKKIQHFHWRGAETGDSLVFELPPLEEVGLYELQMKFIAAPESGKIQIYLDNKKLQGPIDLYSEEPTQMDEISFGKHLLAKGYHEIKIKIVGSDQETTDVRLEQVGFVNVRMLN